MDPNDRTIEAAGMACDRCGSVNLTRVKPTGFVAFAKDYQCLDCNRQFPAPIPTWGSLLFICLGLPLACLGAFWIYANLIRMNPIALVIGGGILVMGATSFWKGITSLFK
ncbi:MAG: hypothetical protein MI757_03395 [Pirellulales bacterium]|nr:hypothetical protein [Pirellulales bacterium]